MKQSPQFGSIYMIVNLLNGRKYIGQTCDKPKYRWKQHLISARNGDLRMLYVAIRQYGESSFEFRVIQDNIPVDILDYTEMFYIAKYESKINGYNIQEGGTKNFTVEFHDEHREKLSEAMVERHKNDPEWSKRNIARMNKARLEKGFSEEHKRAKADKMKGNTLRKGKSTSQETRKKQSKANSGVPKTEAHKQAMRDGWAKRKAKIARLFKLN